MPSLRPRRSPSISSLLALPLVALACHGQTAPDAPAPKDTPPVASASASAPAAPPVAAEPPATTKAPPPALWTVQTQGKTARIVDVVGDRVYALAGAYVEMGSPTRWAISLEASSGRVIWSRDLGETIFARASIVDGLFVLSSTEGKRTVLDATTGAPSPKKPPKDIPKAEDAPLDCKSDAGKLVCRDAKSGAEKWSSAVQEPISLITQPAGKVCHARARVLVVECRDSGSGALLFTHSVPQVPNVKEPDEVHFDYRVVGSKLYVANYDGTIAAFETAP